MLLAFACVTGPAVAAGPDRPSRRDILKTLRPSHPRLLLTDERLDQIKAQAAKDPLLAQIVKDVMTAADRSSAAQRPLKAGSRHRAVGRIGSLAFAWRMTGKKHYADKAVEQLLVACRLKEWRAGFLNTAEMCHATALGYDWLYNYMDQATRREVRQAIITKGLNLGMQSYRHEEGQGWWIRKPHNWNNVCNGGLVIAALAVAESEPQLARQVLDAAMKSIPFGLESYGLDGPCLEGPGYWRYATSYTAYTATAMQTALGTDFGLFDQEGLSNTGWYPIYCVGPSKMFFNYADCGMYYGPRRLPHMYWLARRFNQPAFAQYEQESLQERGGVLSDLYWYFRPSAPPVKRAVDRYFRGPVELFFFRSSWDDPNALFLGIKAGYNQSNHGNLDLGTFVLDALGVRWGWDLGGESYSLPGYWDNEQTGLRWTYYRCGSLSHNVPLLDNTNQHAMGIARVREYDLNRDDSFAVLNLSGGYIRHADRVMRGVQMIDNRRAVLMQDEFDLVKSCQVAWGMTTKAEIAVDGRKATLSMGDKRLHVTAVGLADAGFTVESAEQKPPLGGNEGCRRLMLRFDGDPGRTTRLGIVFQPIWPDGKTTPEPKLTPLADWR